MSAGATARWSSRPSVRPGEREGPRKGKPTTERETNEKTSKKLETKFKMSKKMSVFVHFCWYFQFFSLTYCFDGLEHTYLVFCCLFVVVSVVLDFKNRHLPHLVFL